MRISSGITFGKAVSLCHRHTFLKPFSWTKWRQRSVFVFRICRGTGRSIAMAIGGARECLFVEPGLLNIILDRRMGFIRVAMETGAAKHPAHVSRVSRVGQQPVDMQDIAVLSISLHNAGCVSPSTASSHGRLCLLNT